MKCIQTTNHPKERPPVTVRVSNEEASAQVKKGGWKYVPKHIFKRTLDTAK